METAVKIRTGSWKSFTIYTARLAGYPAVVLTYMETGSISQCQLTLEKIVRLFANESRRYFKDILEYDSYENLFTSVARLLVRGKKGFEEDSFSEELQSLVDERILKQSFKSCGKPGN